MNKKRIIFGFFIILIEIFGLRYWIYEIEKPDPSISIGIFLFVPLLFGINLIIGLVLYFLKNPFSKIFFANSIICPLIFYAYWSLWFMNYQDRISEQYSFIIENRIFEISLSKTSDYFSISDLTNQPNGSTTGLYFGKYERKSDSIKLTDGETKMYIVENKLIGFPEKPNKIKLTETE